MPDVAKFFMEFCMDESCGKCVPCRVGTVQLHRILERVTAGTASRADIEIMKDLCTMMRETSLCGLGQSAPNPLLSTMKFFPEEYEALIKDPPVYVNGNGRFKLPTKPASSTKEVA
jgi:bidirectional [NiFe] hydrogenase diaphorase subunit